MKFAKLAVPTKEDLHGFVDFLTSVHNHVVECLSWAWVFGTDSDGILFLLLCLGFLRGNWLWSEIHDASGSHLSLDLKFEGFNRLKGCLNLELLSSVKLDSHTIHSFGILLLLSITQLLGNHRESTVLLLELGESLKHVLTLETHSISLQLIDGFGVDVFSNLHLLNHLRTVCHRLTSLMALARS